MVEDSNWIILIKKRISIKNIDRLYLKKEKGKVLGRFTHYALFTCFLWMSNIDLTYKARGAARVEAVLGWQALTPFAAICEIDSVQEKKMFTLVMFGVPNTNRKRNWFSSYIWKYLRKFSCWQSSVLISSSSEIFERDQKFTHLTQNGGNYSVQLTDITYPSFPSMMAKTCAVSIDSLVTRSIDTLTLWRK